jgi:hypothetical protein
MFDLNHLVDVLDEIKPDDIPYDKPEFIECLMELMDEYIEKNPKAIVEPDFHDVFLENIKEMTVILFGQGLWEHERWEMDDVIEEAAEIFYETIMPERSLSESIIINKLTSQQIDQLKNHINYLQSILQPEQRTKEWYAFRHTLITASNAYKAFESESTKNQLIWEKCQPLSVTEQLPNDNDTASDSKIITLMQSQHFIQVNVNTPMHHGQKYEPATVMLYELIFGTKVGEFGCIRHSNKKYYFLGASPDGINIDPSSPRFGRMLEIKNVTTREIDGIPKPEYWIQMQLQMEVCDLDECDFLETKFVEYETAEEYWNANDKNNNEEKNDSDGNSDSDGDSDSARDNETRQNNYHGIIMYFTNPHTYEYTPLHIGTNRKEFEKWEDAKMEEHKDKVWIKNCYWKAERISCVLVQRNRRWFEDNIDELAAVWSTIEKERVTGYEHRAPNKRSPNKSNTSGTGCLLKINKETGQAGIMTKQDQVIKVFKVRTESFDEVKEKACIVFDHNV